MTRSQSVLIAGASHGIGATLAAALAARPGIERIFCVARNVNDSGTLEALRQQYDKRIVPMDMDIADEPSVIDASARVRQQTRRLDWVINTVGLLHDGDTLQPERRLADVNVGNIMRSFQVNSVGPLLLAKHLADLLPQRDPCVFATLSARVGSISDNRLGGWYAYRGAKAAQNMFTKNLSIELARKHKRIRVVALHPGTVDTRLSAPFQAAVSAEKLFTTRQSVDYLLKILDNLDDDDNGSFFAWDGQKIAW